ncbi:anaerobic C4-dicarboxylate transporter DcuB [Prevotella communis]|jgi:anaerobic C4-dicarboxylate transporter DcuB|uniref:Anaerobic C4-dicarboxylate transporter DcuB n=2 Tax=Prevotella TaxID=838 RepID=A0A1G7T875_9BACT|nr:anaerobic C4-dicarboxylate transporter [Prevotella communis]MCR5473557.1 anaerobic C4-dicarboxylate transporter [Prevotella sp.]UKK62553.1 anaerobic C4-dicarboxylate transporter [Prevotella communis]UKK65378.1 anaerobic C4-dicarboxylate transporter [Prevotella communis]SDG31292.1 anaerobic C4-dicarboxylate transporter DcuB [Prevotella communis]
MSILMIVELMVVLLALYVGSRYGSLALGAISGIGLAILVFGFGMKPGNPPTDVIYIIIAAVTCAGMLQASGGMDWMIQIAEKLLRNHPKWITFLAPLCTFFLTVFVGTGHVVYTLMPIICDIALKKGIRPERPCGVASIASQVGITCSPIAAAVVAFSAISAENGFEVNNIQIVLISIPACLCGLMAAAAASYNRGLDLDKDPQFQAKLKDPEQYNYIYGNSATTLDKRIAPEAKRAVYVFMLALGVIVMLSVLQIFGINILPSWDGKPLKMNLVIQIVMISAAALMIIFCRAQPKKAVAGPVWQSGMVAVVAIYGIAWMADTYFSNYMPEIQAMLEDIVKSHPWTIAIVFFLVSVLINSQGAVVVSMLPLAYSLGIEGPILLGVLPSVYGYFFIPNYPSDIATVNFDRSGTTIIGKYLLNHSFMMPGLICVFVSTIVAYALSMIFF